MIFSLLTGLLLAAANGQVALAEDVFMGRVVSAGDEQLAIVDDNGENETFKVAAEAKITRNQKPASLEDLQEGDLVKVTATTKGGKATAIKIEARSPE